MASISSGKSPLSRTESVLMAPILLALLLGSLPVLLPLMLYRKFAPGSPA